MTDLWAAAKLLARAVLLYAIVGGAIGLAALIVGGVGFAVIERLTGVEVLQDYGDIALTVWVVVAVVANVVGIRTGIRTWRNGWREYRAERAAMLAARA